MDYSLFGHQIVCHVVEGYNAASIHNAVDGDPVPVPHFGLALTTEQFHSLAEQVDSSGVEFVLKPHLRFKGNCSDIGVRSGPNFCQAPRVAIVMI